MQYLPPPVLFFYKSAKMIVRTLQLLSGNILLPEQILNDIFICYRHTGYAIRKVISFIQSFKLLNNVNCANITVRLANKWFVTHCLLCIIILSFRFLAMSNFLLTKVLKKLWVWQMQTMAQHQLWVTTMQWWSCDGPGQQTSEQTHDKHWFHLISLLIYSKL